MLCYVFYKSIIQILLFYYVFIYNFIKNFIKKNFLIRFVQFLLSICSSVFTKTKFNARTNNYGFVDRLSIYILIYSTNKLFIIVIGL